MPDPFVPLGDAAAGVVAGLTKRREAAAAGIPAADPDAEVIDLAGRVKRLAERHEARREPTNRLLQRVRAEHPAPDKCAGSEVWDPYILRVREAEKVSGLNYR